MANLLYDLQLSVLDSLEDGNFLMDRDSNCNVATFTIKELSKKEDLNIYVLVPSPKKIASLKNTDLIEKVYELFNDDLDKNKVKLIPYDYFGNPFVDRMTFDSRELKEALKEVGNIDIVLTNDPCKVLPYKTFFYYKQKSFIPIICRNHWVSGQLDRKVPVEIDFYIRQFEGAVYSEFMSFNSRFAIKLFTYNASEFFADFKIKEVERKMFNCETVDIEKMDKNRTTMKYDKFTILWAHRLSYYTNFENVFNAYLKLWELRKDWQMFVPDPGNKFTQEELHRKWPFISPINKVRWSHESYLKMCWMSDLTIGAHSYPATWGGLAITEPMAAYTVPLMLEDYCYPEMFYQKPSFPIFFKDFDRMLELTVMYMNNPDILEKMKKESRRFCEEKLSINKYIEEIYSRIKLCTSR